MSTFNVARSIDIQCPIERAFDTVADFGTWTTWSPWLGVDKQARVTVSDNPNSVHSLYSWAGELVGAGEVEHITLDHPRHINEEIRFLKPFKSKSNVGFRFEPDGSGTTVTWSMNGKLPWFMFWMKSMMTTYIGLDYERGLQMLKEYIETGEVLSSIDVLGVEDFAEKQIVGVRRSCSMEEIGPSMKQAFRSVSAKLDCDNGLRAEAISVYHKVDMKAQRFEYTSGFECPPQPSSTDLVTCEIPAGKMLHLRHTGRYENLGNAWSGAHQYARYKKLKLAKRDAVEICHNDPAHTSPSELVADLFLPLR